MANLSRVNYAIKSTFYKKRLTVSLFLAISDMWLALALMSVPNFYDVPDFETCSLNWLPTLFTAIFPA